ncbi:13745_t:CDS:2 [Acaulospora morrowiae]|uniref:13745_t:CDS:1 n=1 Tax=Acaulospora morrowiae TaxID=94023 RepID=A0A9N9BZU6_9GLOM|nr:13745_t:CDS:2 [Acaulospora morrowiae]
MSANEHTRDSLTNTIMPSQSNEMLSYDVFGDSSHLATCSESDNLFQEDSGKYDLDTVSVFVAKLYQLLDGDEYKEYLTWNETGDVFVICNMDEFAQNVLPKYFKHCKFTSFVRQLNIYGFYRVSDARKSKHVRSKHACVFSHSQFRRGRQDLLPNIRRKVTKNLRKTRRQEPSILKNQGEPNPVSPPPSVYGSPTNSKDGSIAKDATSHYLINSFTESKDFATHVDKSESESAMRRRIAELTETTENLRKDLKNMNDIVNERLLPEVRSLTEDLHKQHVHLMELTQLVAYHSSPEGIQLLQEVNRGYTKHMLSHDLPSAKRMRLDNKRTASVKTEQSNLSSSAVTTNTPTVPSSVANVPTVPSSSVPASYDNIFTGNSLMNASSPTTDPSAERTPSVSQQLTIPRDTHAFDLPGSSIIDEFQHSPHSAHPCVSGFNESWSPTCHSSVLVSDPVNTVPNPFLFSTATSDHSPIMYSPTSNKNSSPHSQHEQLSPPASSVAPSLSPAEYNDSTTNPVDLISNAVTVASNSSDDRHNGSSNGDVVVAVSPTSTTSSSPTSQATATLTNFYQPPILDIYNPFHSY